jgi:translation elongation factor EF-1beta
MNYKLKGRTLCDIVSPEIPYAQFSENISKVEMKKMVSAINHGLEMLQIYQQMRNESFHVQSVCDALQKMEKIWAEWDYENYENNAKKII